MKLNINGKTIEVEDSVVSKAIEDKAELEVKSDLVIRTTEEDSQLQANLVKEGNKSAYEIGRKEVIKGLGIEAEGVHKSTDSSINAIKDFMKAQTSDAIKAAKIEPSKQVEQLTKDLDTMRNSFNQAEQKAQELEGKRKEDRQNFQKDTVLRSLIPTNVIDNDLAMLALKSKLKIGFDDNDNMFGFDDNGQPLRDAQLNNLPIESVVNDFFSSMPALLKTPSGGAGGGDSSGGGAKQKIDDFIKEMKDKGVYLNSPEFNQAKNERIEAGSLDA